MELQAFVVPLVSALLGAGGGGAIVIAIINRRPGLIKAQSEAAGEAVEQWRHLYKQTRAELDKLRGEAEKMQSSYYGLLGVFVQFKQFRNAVSQGVGDVVEALDRQNLADAVESAESLGRLAEGVRLPTEDKS